MEHWGTISHRLQHGFYENDEISSLDCVTRGGVSGDETASSVSAGEVSTDNNTVSRVTYIAPHIALLGVLSFLLAPPFASLPPSSLSHAPLVLPPLALAVLPLHSALALFSLGLSVPSTWRAYCAHPSVHCVSPAPCAPVAENGILSSPSSFSSIVGLFSCLVGRRLC